MLEPCLDIGRRRLAEHSRDDLLAKRAIGLELRLGEELFRSWLIGEGRVGSPIRVDVSRQARTQARLDLEDPACAAVGEADTA